MSRTTVEVLGELEAIGVCVRVASLLAAAGRAQQQRTITGDRPAELWTAARAPVT